MLRILSLTAAQQRELRQWQRGKDPRLARRAQFVLWSARGWSVPALAQRSHYKKRGAIPPEFEQVQLYN